MKDEDGERISSFILPPSSFAVSSLPTSVVVVVFPALPVMPTVVTPAGQASRKICESLLKGTPRRRASCASGTFASTPPERQSKSALSRRVGGWPPKTYSIGKLLTDVIKVGGEG